MNFKDHFSKRAQDYAQYRPGYPEALFEYLASLSPKKKIALDCATGNGQAAVGLAEHFKQVIATDPSRKQISHAVKHDHVNYCIALAERTPVLSKSMDLVTIAQALHWVDLPKFFKEVKRVLKPEGHVAVWCYNLLHVHPRIDVILYRYYTEIVGPYWPPERKMTEDGYQSIEFPFEEVETPTVHMNAEWNLNDLTGYLRTWSSSQKYFQKNKKDPLKEINQELSQAWGPATDKKKVYWPVNLRVGKNTS